MCGIFLAVFIIPISTSPFIQLHFQAPLCNLLYLGRGHFKISNYNLAYKLFLNNLFCFYASFILMSVATVNIAYFLLLRFRYSSDKDEWEKALVQAEGELDDTSRRLTTALSQLTEAKETTERLATEVSRLEVRLTEAIEENEALYARLKPGSNRARSMDSLSDLTNIDLTLDLSRLDKERLVIIQKI